MFDVAKGRGRAHRSRSVASTGVSLSADGDVACIHLDDGGGNVLGSTTLRALGRAIEDATSAGAVLLRGRDRIFSGGLDLNEVSHLSRAELLDFLSLLHATRRALFALPRPVVVAVAGSAVGAGATLLCCGDRRLGARDKGRVCFPEVELDVPLPSCSMQIVTTALAPASAHRALLFGESFGRSQALALGLFHELVEPDHLVEAAWTAARAAATLPAAAGSIKFALRRDALRRMDAERAASHEAFVTAWTSETTQARIDALLERLARRSARRCH